MERLNLDKTTLRKFVLLMCFALFLIGIVLFLKHKTDFIWFYLSGIIFFLIGLLAPNLLKWLYIIWMRLAFILGWMNTRLILGIIFYLMFTPLGLVMRLFKVDLLDRKIEKTKISYWKDTEKRDFNPTNYERLF